MMIKCEKDYDAATVAKAVLLDYLDNSHRKENAEWIDNNEKQMNDAFSTLVLITERYPKPAGV